MDDFSYLNFYSATGFWNFKGFFEYQIFEMWRPYVREHISNSKYSVTWLPVLFVGTIFVITIDFWFYLGHLLFTLCFELFTFSIFCYKQVNSLTYGGRIRSSCSKKICDINKYHRHVELRREYFKYWKKFSDPTVSKIYVDLGGNHKALNNLNDVKNQFIYNRFYAPKAIAEVERLFFAKLKKDQEDEKKRQDEINYGGYYDDF